MDNKLRETVGSVRRKPDPRANPLAGPAEHPMAVNVYERLKQLVSDQEVVTALDDFSNEIRANLNRIDALLDAFETKLAAYEGRVAALESRPETPATSKWVQPAPTVITTQVPVPQTQPAP